MGASQRDRRHFEAIAEAMQAKAEEERSEVLETTVAERIALGFILGAGARDEATERALDERAQDQIGLARRRLALRR
jgi:hypothetical protein